MNWKDEQTAFLKDNSIVNFNEDGSVELFFSKKSTWKKQRTKDKFKNKYCHTFKFPTKEQAIKVFTELENNL